MITTRKQLFDLGQTVATPAAIEVLNNAKVSPKELLDRHINGDFGVLSDDDRQANMDAIDDEARLLSVYPLESGETVWIITEADRSSTCILLPDEY